MESTKTVLLSMVPDPDEPEGGQIFLDVDFDGQIHRSVLDTGAQSTKVMKDSFFASYKSIDTKHLMGLSGKAAEVATIQIEHVKIGTHDLGSLDVACVPAAMKIPTTVGVDLFQGQQFTFNFPKATLRFDTPVVMGTPLHIWKDRHLLIPVSFGTESFEMIWDTGAGLTTIDQELIKKHPDNFNFLKTLNVGDIVQENAFQLKLYLAKELKVGNNTFKEVKVLAADFRPLWEKLGTKSIHGALGYNMLTQHSWSFDLKNKMYTVQ